MSRAIADMHLREIERLTRERDTCGDPARVAFLSLCIAMSRHSEPLQRAVPGLPEGCAVRHESDGFVLVTDGEMFGPYTTEREAIDAAWDGGK